MTSPTTSGTSSAGSATEKRAALDDFDPPGEDYQDRRKGCLPCPIHHLADGRDSDIEGFVCCHPRLDIVLIPNWLDAEHIPIENRTGTEEVPTEASIGRLYVKSRFNEYEDS